MYMTEIPLRASATVDRPSKQTDGSAMTGEMKAVTVWRTEMRNSKGQPARNSGSESCNATIELVTNSPETRGSPSLPGELGAKQDGEDFLTLRPSGD